MLEPCKILLVDNDHNFTKTMGDFLESQGYSPSIANTAKKALKKIKTELPHVALVDVNLGGAELLEEFSTLSPQTKYIAVNGDTSKDITSEALNQDVFGFMHKSYAVEQFLQMIRSAVKSRSTEIALLASEGGYRSLYDFVPEGILTVDLEGMITSCNQVYLDIRGFLRDEVVGKNFGELPKTGQFDPSQYKKMFSTTLKENLPGPFVVNTVHKGGAISYLEMRFGLIKSDDEVVGFQAIIRDVTQQVEVERALRESEARITSFINSATGIFALFDSDLNLVLTNDAALALFPAGTRREDLIGKHILEISPELEENGRYAEYQKVIKTGDPYFIEDAIPGTAFGDIFLDIKAFKVGEGLGTIIENVTERVQTQAALRESKEKYQTLLETIPYGIQEIDTSGIIQYSNPAHHKIRGYPAGELVGTHVWDELGTKTEQQELQAYYAMLIEKQPPSKTQFTYNVTPDGEVKDVQVDWNYKRNVKGEVTGFISVITDISERKQAEDDLRDSETRLKEAQKIASIGYWDLNNIDNTLEWSDEVSRIFGLTIQNDVKSYELFLSAIHPDDRDNVNKAFRDSLQNKTPYKITHRVIHPNGDIRFVKEQCVTEYNEEGTPIRSLGTVQDITDQKLAEEEIKNRNQALASLNIISTAINESKTLDKLLEVMLQQVVTSAGADGAEYHLVDTDGSLYLKKAWNLDETFVSKSDTFRFPLSVGIPGQAFERRELIYVANAPTDNRYLRRELAEAAGYHSLLCIPVFGHDFFLGTFMLYSREQREFSSELGEMMMTMGSQLAVAADRFRAEDELRVSKERFETAIMRAPIPMLIVDANQDIVLFNERFTASFGYTLEDISTTEEWWLATCPDEEYRQLIQNSWTVAIAQITENGDEIEMQEWDLTTKDGSVRHVEFEMTVLGKISLITMNDITERMRAEEQIRFQAQLLGSVRESVIATDMEGNITYWGRGAEKLYGYAFDELQGSSIAVIYETTEENDAHRHQVFEAGEWRGQFHQKRKNGTSFLVDTNLFLVVDALGNPAGVIGINHDITEQKQIEEQLRLQASALEFAADSIIITDAQGFILWINPAFEKLTGYSPDEAIGNTLRILNSGIHDRAFYKQFWDTILAGQTWQGDLVNKRKDGSLYTTSLIATPVVDSNGDITHFVSIQRDVSEQTLATEALRESELRYRSLFDSLTDAAFIYPLEEGRPPGNFIVVNDIACQRLGYTREELLTKNFRDITFMRGVDVPENAANLISTGHVFIETEHVTKDGMRIPVEVSANVVNLDGRQMILSLARDVTERKQAEIKIQKFAHDLGERVKELNSLYVISTLIETPGIPLEEIFRGTIDISPSAWQYPEITSARLIIQGDDYTTDNFKEGKWRQASDVYVDGSHVGILEIFYLQEMPEIDEGPFLKEERNLINAITERLGRVIERFQTDKELISQKEMFENLVAVAHATAEMPALDDTLQNTLKVVASLTKAEHSSLFLFDEEGQVIFSGLSRGEVTPQQRAPLVDSVMHTGLAGWVYEHHELAIIEDTEKDERWLTLPDQPYVARSALGVPVLSGGRLLGILILHDSEPGHFSPEDGQLMQAAADQVALALRNAQMYDEQLRLAKRQTILYETLETVGSQLELDLTIKAAVEKVSQTTGWPVISIYLADSDDVDESMVLGAQAVVGIESFSSRERLQIDQGIIGRAFRTKKTQLAQNVEKDPDYIEASPELKSELSVPMHRGDRVLGVLDIQSDQRGMFTEEDVLVAESLADAIALALENALFFEELQKTTERLREVDRLKSNFLANMSHEIRTPLNAIIGMTNLMTDSKLTPTQWGYAETISKSGKLLLSIINDILDFSRIEADKLELDYAPLNLWISVEGALDLLSTAAEEKGLDLFYRIAEGVPVNIIGDSTRLHQILVNLINNAIKFTEAGEINLSVDSLPLDDKRFELKFSVQDTGIGIPTDKQEEIFQAFSQIDASSSRAHSGTGLGLVISQRLITLMGGEIHVESEVGRGSTFAFTIVAEAAPGDHPEFLLKEQPLLAKKRLMVVSENENIRNFLAHNTRYWDMKPQLFSSGQEAWNALKNGTQFDVAIIDIEVSGKQGETLAEDMQAVNSELPIIMLTPLRRSFQIIPGKYHTLSKPIKISHLYRIMQHVCSGRGVPDQEGWKAKSYPNLSEFIPLRILIAEDNLVNQEVTLLSLSKIGYTADIAENGLEALSRLKKEAYDVILMDVQMPHMDGLETTRCIRTELSEDQQPYIIAVTAHAYKEDRDRCLAAGMNDYLEKPFLIEELVEVLRKHSPQVDIDQSLLSSETSSHHSKTDLFPTEIDQKTFENLRRAMFYEDETPFFNLIDVYLDTTPSLLKNLGQAVEDDNGDLVQRHAHDVKSTSNAFGAKKFAMLCDSLEKMGEEGNLSDGKELLVKIEVEYKMIKKALILLKDGLK